jgi:hypothetical protein
MQWSVVVVTPPLMILSLLVGMAALNGKNHSSKRNGKNMVSYDWLIYSSIHHLVFHEIGVLKLNIADLGILLATN